MTTATKMDAAAAILTLRHFIGPAQLTALAHACRGEEKQFFYDKLVELAALTASMPKTYEQDGLGDKAIVHLHYFRGGMDFHVTERDMETEQLQAYGLADLGYGGELGYICIAELIAHGVELDLYWTPKPLGEIRERQAA